MPVSDANSALPSAGWHYLGLKETQAQPTALDALRPLAERADDAELALVSDVMAVAPEGYALPKVSDRSEALKSARNELSVRFAKRPHKEEALAA